jgi:hypothetical protein
LSARGFLLDRRRAAGAGGDPDRAAAPAVPLMIALYREFRAGASLAEALRDARRGLESDPVAAATGWSFICLSS